MEIFPKDIVARFGGKALSQHGVFMVPGASRGLVETKETVTRASTALIGDRDRNVKVAAIDKLRMHYPPGLVDASGQPLGGVLAEGTRQNKIENGDYETDAVGSNIRVGATLLRDQTNVRHGAWALKVTVANSVQSGMHWVPKAGGRIVAVAARAYTVEVDVYAPAASVGKTLRVGMEWWNAIPAAISNSNGPTTALVAGWQRLIFTVTSPANTAFAVPFIELNAAQGIFDFWVDIADFQEGAFASEPVPTNTAVAMRSADQIDVAIVLDMARDWSLYLWFHAHHANVATWPDTEPQLDAFMLGLYPTTAGADANDSLRLHRQNTATQYEWEYGSNSPTASRTFTVTSNPQKLVLRHRASDHVLDAAIDGGAFAVSAAPSGVTFRPLVLLRFLNTGFWTLFDGMLARGLFTQPEFEAVP